MKYFFSDKDDKYKLKEDYYEIKYVYHFITDFVFAILISIAQIEGLFYYFKSFKCLFYAYHDI